MSEVSILGIGIHPFGRHEGRSGLDMAEYATRAALADAGIDWNQIGFAYGASDASGNPDTLVERLGLTGIQFINVRNGCAAGGSALFAAATMIRAGADGPGLVIGFDKHPRGAFDPRPAEYGLPDWWGEAGYMLTTQFFACKIQRYMTRFGISRTTLGRVAEKAFANGVLAPHAWRRAPVALAEIMGAPLVNDPYSKFMFCSPAEGAVALVVGTPAQARKLGKPDIRLRAAVMRTRPPGSFEVFAPYVDKGGGDASATRLAAAAAFEEAGIGPEDIAVAQLQDTESGAEIMHMAENGFCVDGEQEGMIAEGATRIGGRLPVNTDGGCLACGEPIGASGLRQVLENVLQLRGQGGGRQVLGDPRTAYSHVYGAPGVSAVTILER